MAKLVWSTLCNSTEISEDSGGISTFNSTVALPTASASSTVPVQLVSTVGLIVTSVGICANAVVLFVLVRARRQFGSSVHTLIANQSAMDVFTCVFGMCTLAMMITPEHDYRYYGDRILDGAVCVLFEGTAHTAVGLTASIIGLMVITLERYFKIVHAIAHRKYYRDWMTSVGVALPWVGGTCLILFPAMGASRIVNGRCLRMAIWPNKAMALAFSAVRFLFHYALPVSVFAYCYGRIFHTIRQQSKVVSGHAGRTQDVPMATTSRDQNHGQIQQQATGTTTGAKLSRTELNVLKTMITVIVCFMMFWSVTAIANLLQLVGIAALDRNAFFLSGSLSYISFCVNPFIYASRYEAFRRYVKQIVSKTSSTASGAG